MIDPHTCSQAKCLARAAYRPQGGAVPRISGSEMTGCPTWRGRRMPGCPHVAGSRRQAVPRGRLSHVAGADAGLSRGGEAGRGLSHMVGSGRQGCAVRQRSACRWGGLATCSKAATVPPTRALTSGGEHPQHHAGGAVTASPSLPLAPFRGGHLQPWGWRGEPEGGSCRIQAESRTACFPSFPPRRRHSRSTGGPPQ